MRPFASILLLLTAVASIAAEPAATTDTETVQVLRVPNGGIQPDAAVDADGVIHVVYLVGEPSAADVFYSRSPDGGRTFSRPVRVNSQQGSAVATGTIRGAQIALGRGGRVHVAWNGSATAQPQGPTDSATKRAGAPMLYSRSTASGSAFEPQRNLMTATTNLDGGGSIAADDRGGVYVAWHAHPASGGGSEEARRVWIARSSDDGETFGREKAVSDPSTGACGCCALRLFVAPQGDLHLLYRSAIDKIHRDIYRLVSRDRGASFSGGRVDGWEIAACPMTSMSIAAGPHVLGAWETGGQVFYEPLDGSQTPIAPPQAAERAERSADAAAAHARKHPRLAVNRAGTVLLVWTEGTAWARGGSLAWQAFTADGKPTAVRGNRPDVPVWSFGTVVARGDGGFTILY